LILVSFSEELVFRGYILNNLLHSMPKMPALLVSALLFAGFHTLNPGMSLIGFLNIFIAGVLMGINYIFSRNLWFAVFFHFSWNFFQGPVLGFEVSGLDLPVMLEQNLRGSTLLTGGAFGLEASWLATFVLSITTLILFLLFQRKYSIVE
jgi:membrane protease YdiL (CAAX protease family)